MSIPKKNVDIFICSSFHDMHHEREALVKRVFPELRENSTEYNIQPVDIDLNWGLANDPSDHERILEIIGSELNRSSLMISILGEMFGSIPKDEYDSLVALEIYRAISDSSTELMVFERGSDLTSQFSKQDKDNIYYEDDNYLKTEQVKLKRRLTYLGNKLIPYETIDEFTEVSYEKIYNYLDVNYFSKHGTVFISYSRFNIEDAEKFANYLQLSGYSTWFDKQGIALGDKWVKQITDGITESDVVLFLISKSSIESDWCLNEILMAKDKKKPVLAVFLENVELPDDIKIAIIRDQHLYLHDFETTESQVDAILKGLKNQLQE